MDTNLSKIYIQQLQFDLPQSDQSILGEFNS